VQSNPNVQRARTKTHTVQIICFKVNPSYSANRFLFLALLCIRSICVFAGGGGFVPQSLIDSSELSDSTIVRNAKNGHKGKFFIQFSFRFLRRSGWDSGLPRAHSVHSLPHAETHPRTDPAGRLYMVGAFPWEFWAI